MQLLLQGGDFILQFSNFWLQSTFFFPATFLCLRLQLSTLICFGYDFSIELHYLVFISTGIGYLSCSRRCVSCSRNSRLTYGGMTSFSDGHLTLKSRISLFSFLIFGSSLRSSFQPPSSTLHSNSLSSFFLTAIWAWILLV